MSHGRDLRPAKFALQELLLSCHRLNGLRSDLAVLCASGPAGQPGSIDRVRREIEVGPGADRVDKPGGIYVLDGATLDEGDSTLLRSVERIVLTDTDPLDAQIARRVDDVRSEPAPIPTPAAREGTRRGPPVDPPAANGFGDFSPDGREYVITTSAEHMTPALWVNVIANPEFGTLVSESGSATTWSENAHEFRLTPWSNDPVSDPNTEAFYIRDESTGRF